MAIAYKTRFVAPYANGKINLPVCPRCAQTGVYFIKSNRTGKIIYIGYSASNLYKTISRHFQTWNDKSQQRFVYGRDHYTVRVIFTNAERAALLEKFLIVKHNPRDNKMKYDNYLTPAEERKAEKIEEAAQWLSISDEVPF